MAKHYNKDLNLVTDWPDNMDPANWREMPQDPVEELEEEDLEDEPTPQYVIDMLGFDPEELDDIDADSLDEHDEEPPAKLGSNYA